MDVGDDHGHADELLGVDRFNAIVKQVAFERVGVFGGQALVFQLQGLIKRRGVLT